MGEKILKTLEEHNETKSDFYREMTGGERLNGIACPNCGAELYDSSPMVIFTSSPSKKNVHCSKCNYVGYRIA